MSQPESTAAGMEAGSGPLTVSAAISRPEAYLALTAILFMLYFAWLVRDYYVDDAYIGFQYLKNLLAGHGFVFYPGDAVVEGVTNIGWQIVLAPFALFAGPPAAAKVLGIALTLATLLLVARIGGRAAQGPDPAPGFGGFWLLPLALLATSFEFLYFAFAGMETALLAALLLAMAWSAAKDAASWRLPALCAAAYLVHPEAILIFPLYAAVGLATGLGERRRMVAALGGLAAMALAITALRFAYFGDVVPNTFHAKGGSAFLRIDGGFQALAGQNVNIAFPLTGVAALPFLVFGYLRVRRASPALATMLAAIVACGVAFGIYSPPDWTGLGRYFAPYLPAALILLWCGIVEAARKVMGDHRRASGGRLVALTAIVLLATQLYGVLVGMARMEGYPGYVMAGRTLVAPAEWIRDNLPPDATVATRRIGALAYHSDRRVFDYVHGLTERDVAARVADRGARFDAFDADLAELWTARTPDYLLEDADMIDKIATAVRGNADLFVLHGTAYRVVRRFPIGSDTDWVLAGRIELP